VRTLGVHYAAGTLYLAAVEDGAVGDTVPASLVPAAGLPDPKRLPGLLDDVRKIV